MRESPVYSSSTSLRISSKTRQSVITLGLSIGVLRDVPLVVLLKLLRLLRLVLHNQSVPSLLQHVHEGLQHGRVLPGSSVLAECCFLQVPVHVVQSCATNPLELVLQVKVAPLAFVGVDTQPAIAFGVGSDAKIFGPRNHSS